MRMRPSERPSKISTVAMVALQYVDAWCFPSGCTSDASDTSTIAVTAPSTGRSRVSGMPKDGKIAQYVAPTPAVSSEEDKIAAWSELAKLYASIGDEEVCPAPCFRAQAFLRM